MNRQQFSSVKKKKLYQPSSRTKCLQNKKSSFLRLELNTVIIQHDILHMYIFLLGVPLNLINFDIN